MSIIEYGLPVLDDSAAYQGIVDALPDPTNLIGSRFFREQPVDTDPAEWDIVRGNRRLTPNVGVDDPARQAPKSQMAKATAFLAYFRESILRKARELQAVMMAQSQRDKDRITAKFTRDIQDVKNGITMTREFQRWEALRGLIHITMANGQAFDVDTQLPAANRVVGAINFSVAATDVRLTLQNWLDWLALFGGSNCTLIGSRTSIDYILNVNTYFSGMIKASPVLTGQMVTRGIITDPVLGIKFEPYLECYQAADGTATPYINPFELFLIAENEKVGLDLAGPPPDLNADQGARGWYGVPDIDEKDPSGRKQVVGYVGLPVLKYPWRVIYCPDCRAAALAA